MPNYYNPDTHEYFIDGVRVPSVTEIIPPPDFSFVSPEHLEQCRVEGEEDHSKIKMYLDTRDTFGDPYLQRFEAFLKEHEEEFGKLIMYETLQFSEAFKFAGRPDIVFEHAILDLKRKPSNTKRHALQLAGYALLVDGSYPRERYIIWDDGKIFHLRNVYKPVADDIFLQLLDRYYIDQAYKNYMKPIKRNGGQDE
jgi:hypothetical protein